MSTAHEEGSAVDGSPVKDRTVVVTGAARGVGAALADALAHRGARLALLDHDETALEATAAALPGEPLALRVDVTDGTALADAAEVVRGRLGPASVVVANAGIAEGGPFIQGDPATWQRVIDVNLTGSARTARAFLPDLLQTAGYHLQIASLASIGAAPMMSAYCASKAGVEAFTHTLRAEVAHHGVAVGAPTCPLPSGASTPPMLSPPAWPVPSSNDAPPSTSPPGYACSRWAEPRSRPSYSDGPGTYCPAWRTRTHWAPPACWVPEAAPTAPLRRAGVSFTSRRVRTPIIANA
jgi:NAD(P)-dependent dehydrogenase (short-subunit alcohol dehydrogenase family)